MAEERSPEVTRRELLAATVAAATIPLAPVAVTAHPGALTAYQAGRDAYGLYTAAANTLARGYFETALALDPTCVRACAMLAATYRQEATMAWGANRDTSEAQAWRFAQDAVRLARQEPAPQPSLPYALEQWAWVLFYQARDYDAALAAIREATTASPTYASGHAMEGHVLIYMMQPEAAIRKAQDAFTLNPAALLHHHYDLGHAHYVWGWLSGDASHYGQAIAHLEQVLTINAQYRPARIFLVAALWELGRYAEARTHTAMLMALGRPRATANLAQFAAYCSRSHPYTDQALLAHLIQVWAAAEGVEGI